MGKLDWYGVILHGAIASAWVWLASLFAPYTLTGATWPHIWLNALAIGAYGLLRELTRDWHMNVNVEEIYHYKYRIQGWRYFVRQNLVWPFVGWPGKIAPQHMTLAKWAEGIAWPVAATVTAIWLNT
jgi:hypothetical protein